MLMNSKICLVTGRYFVNKKIAESSPQSRDPHLAQRLWDMSEKLTKLHSP